MATSSRKSTAPYSKSGSASSEFLDGPAVWEAIRREARSRGSRWVASPYVGKGAAGQIKWRKGDVLLCALTENNARNGTVDPREVRKLLKLGVRVLIEEELHAKVALFETSAIVGSANLSQNSVEQLDEAAILSRAPSMLAKVRTWFKQRMGRPVTPGWLKLCEKVFKPAKRPGGTKSKNKDSQTGTLFWVVKADPSQVPAEDEAAFRREQKVAARRKQRKKGFELVWVWGEWDTMAERASRGDLIVDAVWENGAYRVSPHGRLLHKFSRPTKTGHRWYFFYEQPSSYETLTWSKFARVCERHGIRLSNTRWTQELKARGAPRRAIEWATSPDTLAV